MAAERSVPAIKKRGTAPRKLKLGAENETLNKQFFESLLLYTQNLNFYKKSRKKRVAT